jgi:hypothetical protein
MDIQIHEYCILLFIIIVIAVLIYYNYFDNELKLDCVLTACNDNPMYMECIPIFIKSWNTLYPNVDVKVILISDSIPNELDEYNNNIILLPLNKIGLSKESEPFVSVYIRYLYPSLLNYTNGIMITDVDMLPMNKNYFNFKGIDKSKYVNTRDWNDGYQFASCYNIATSKVWSEVFNISNFDDIKIRLHDIWYNELDSIPQKLINDSPYKGWYKDQIDALKYVTIWNKITNNLLILKDKDTGYNRLDRANQCRMNNDIKLNIIDGKYSDYHICRPYSKHKEFNDEIVELLKQIR